MTSAKGPVIIYRLVGGREGIGGITLFLGEQKGGSLKTLDLGGGGGSGESHQMLLGGITSVK